MAAYRSLKRLWSVRVSGLGALPLFLLRVILTLFGMLIRVEGAERIDRLGEPAVFALNHNNYAETFFLPCLLMSLTGRKVSFLVHWMWKDFPVIGRLMRFVDPVWVWTLRVRFSFGRRKRLSPETAAVPAAVRRFREGTSLGIFPEGTRNHRPRTLLKARRGLGEIALRCRAKVIPVGIDFPARVRRGRIPVLGRMVVRIGSPLDLSDEQSSWDELEARDGAGRADDRRRAWELVDRVTDKTMAAISRLCGKRYVFRPRFRKDVESASRRSLSRAKSRDSGRAPGGGEHGERREK